MFKFLWDNKPDKIKRKIITKDYKEGTETFLGLQLLGY